MSDLMTLRAELATATAELEAKNTAIKIVEEMAKKAKQDPGEALAQFVIVRDAKQAEVTKLTSQIESAERSERTKTIVEPLIEKFGTFSVDNATEFRVEFVDIPSTIEKLNTDVAAINSKLNALKHLSSVLVALEISDETAADLKAVRFEVAGPKSYKLAMAKAAGTRAGGTRTSTKGEIFTITKAGEGYESLVGSKIGKDLDFPNWKAVIAKANPEKFAELEAKRLGTFPGSEGKHSNYSASAYAAKLFGVEWSSEKVTEAETEVEAEAPADPS